MDLKKRLIFLLVVVLLLVNIVAFLTVFFATSEHFDETTAAASATAVGTASFCYARPPLITVIANQNAIVGTAFTLQVATTFYGANTSITYTDNTSLFVINQSGYISFTPSLSQVGTHSILISISDASNCNPAPASTVTFSLTVSSEDEDDDDQGGAGSGGGGGGGGGGESGGVQKTKSFVLSLEYQELQL